MWQNIHLVLLTLLTHFTWGHLSSRALLEHIIIQLYMLYLCHVLTSISCFKLQSSMSTQRTQPQSCLYNYLNSAPLLQLLWWTLCVPAAAVVSFSNSSGGLWPMSHLPPYSYSHRLCCFFFSSWNFFGRKCSQQKSCLQHTAQQFTERRCHRAGCQTALRYILNRNLLEQRDRLKIPTQRLADNPGD